MDLRQALGDGQQVGRHLVVRDAALDPRLKNEPARIGAVEVGGNPDVGGRAW